MRWLKHSAWQSVFCFIGNSDFKELKENKSSPNMC